MRIGFWSPLPPQRSGIADYSYELLPAIQEWADVVAVVRDDFGDHVRAPKGIEIIEASDFEANSVDLCIYQMGNNPPFHSFMLKALQNDPGLLVLHDPSLVDFYSALCRDTRGPIFREEVIYNCPDIRLNDELPTVRVMDRMNLDRMKLLLSRRVIDASLMTLVHSPWISSYLVNRFVGASIESVNLGAPLLEQTTPQSSDVIFGVFGGVSFYKRVLETLRAFKVVHAKFANTRLLIAGRIDEKKLEKEIATYVAKHALGNAVSVRSDLSLPELEGLIQSCHVAISLRWPTAGEMSATLMRAFGAGRPAIVSDLPQFRHFDEQFCWRVPISPYLEHKALVERMSAVANDKTIALRAGEQARDFVARHATYEIVNETYQRLATSCAAQRRERQHPEPRRSHPSEAVAVNARYSWSSSRDWNSVAFRAIRSANAAGVLIALSDVETEEPLDCDWLPLDLRYLQQSRPHHIDLEFGDLRSLAEREDRPGDDPLYRIFYLDEEPPFQVSVPTAPHVDEIWVVSNFVKELIAAQTNVNVVVVPPMVECCDPEQLGRSDFGLPEKAVVILVRADGQENLRRSNHLAAIEAFRAAFGDQTNDQVILAIHAPDLDENSETTSQVREGIDRMGGVLIEDDLTASESMALVHASDIVLSLRHLEAFGMSIAEAMLLGKPVVATAYSGCADYLDESNGVPIGFDLLPIPMNHHQNDRPSMGTGSEMLWPKPDITQAAHQLRRLVDDFELREVLGQRAQDTITGRFNRLCAGSAIRERLEVVMPGRRVVQPTSLATAK